LNRRFANGFTMTVSYTIAKTLEQVSLLNAQDVNLQNLTSSKLEKRLIQYDVPQQLSIIGTVFRRGEPLAAWMNPTHSGQEP